MPTVDCNDGRAPPSRTELSSVGSPVERIFSLLPAGFAQAFDYVGMVLRPKPRRALTDMHVERGRRDLYGLLQRFLRFFDPADLAEGGGEPAVGRREVGV